MKLVVGIDGESYTKLSYAFVETEEEAFAWVKEDVKEYDCFKIEKDGDKIYAQYYASDFSVGMVHIPSFHVYQLFDIDESKPFAVVHWYIYAALSFDIIQFNTYKEARKYMDDTVDDMVVTNKKHSIVCFDDVSACVDGMMWSIIDLRRGNGKT